MTRTSSVLLALSATLFLSSCSTAYESYYLKDSFGFKQVCLVDNRGVPPSFFIALRTALEDKGLDVKTVRKFDPKDPTCEAVVLNEATYERIPFNHLSDARLILISDRHPTEVISLKKDETPVALLDKMSDEEPRIREMVNRLLPRETPW